MAEHHAADAEQLYRTVSSELLVDAPTIALRRDVITTRTGEVTREIVEHFSAVAVLAVRGPGSTARGTAIDAAEAGAEPEVLLIRQWRQGVRRYLWEVPAGILDKLDEDPLTAAQRELAEEAGLEAEEWSLAGDVVTSPGFCEEMVRIYRADQVRDLATGHGYELDEATGEEADLDARWVPVSEAVQWVQRGEITNSIAVAAIFHLSHATRRDHAEPFNYPRTMATRRRAAAEAAGGSDMKHVR